MWNNLPALISELSQSVTVTVRCFLRGEDEPTNWGKWLISPTTGYLEIQGYGPFKISEIIWCEIQTDELISEADKRALIGFGFQESSQTLFKCDT